MTDREILRDVAQRVREISLREDQSEKVRLWKACNDLKPIRPMVFTDPQGGWSDIEREWIELECVDQNARELELELRRIVVRDEHIPDDFPIDDVYRVEPIVEGGGYNDYGVPLLSTMPEESHGAYHIDPVITSAEDMGKLRPRPIHLDGAATKEHCEIVEDQIGDILRVRRVGRSFWRYGLTRVLIHMRGFEQMLLDFYENPSILRSLMQFLMDDYLRELQIYEREGAIGSSNFPQFALGSGGLGFCSDLPTEADLDNRVETKQSVAWGESQETVGVGPDQFEEFVLKYQLPLLRRFGLVDYGCCEGLETKVDLLIDKIPNLRWISVSTWADRERMAERIDGKYVYVYKPNPATICAGTPDWDSARGEIRETLEIVGDAPIHLVMKDTKTFQNDPGRITEWCRMAKDLACYG